MLCCLARSVMFKHNSTNVYINTFWQCLLFVHVHFGAFSDLKLHIWTWHLIQSRRRCTNNISTQLTTYLCPLPSVHNNNYDDHCQQYHNNHNTDSNNHCYSVWNVVMFLLEICNHKCWIHDHDDNDDDDDDDDDDDYDNVFIKDLQPQMLNTWWWWWWWWWWWRWCLASVASFVPG